MIWWTKIINQLVKSFSLLLYFKNRLIMLFNKREKKLCSIKISNRIIACCIGIWFSISVWSKLRFISSRMINLKSFTFNKHTNFRNIISRESKNWNKVCFRKFTIFWCKTQKVLWHRKLVWWINQIVLIALIRTKIKN